MRRNEVKSRGQALREELNQTVEHAKRAAGHAAGGVGAAVGPRVATARDTVPSRIRGTAARGWGSTVAAAQSKMGNGRLRRKQGTKRRYPALAGLLAAGALVGGITAALLRRRESGSAASSAADDRGDVQAEARHPGRDNSKINAEA